MAALTSSTIATLNASTGTTTLVLIVLLIALGVAMVLTAVWLVGATRSDAPALAPLEAMGTRRWARADADRRSALLTSARPDGAPDPAPIVPYGDEPEPAADAAPPPERQPVAAADPGTQPEPVSDAARQPEPEPEALAAAEPATEVDEPVAAPESS